MRYMAHSARFRTRLAAFTIDITILGLAAGIISVIFFDGSLFQLILETPGSVDELLCISLMEAAYYIVLTALFGQTAGKWWLGIEVIDLPSGIKPGFFQSFIRYSPYILLAILNMVALSRAEVPPDALDNAVTGAKSLLDNTPGLVESVNSWQWTLNGLRDPEHPARQIMAGFSLDDTAMAATILWYLASAITLFFSRSNRTLHDYMAQTAVIHSDVKVPY